MRFVLLLSLAGCPYVFGPADYSKVGAGDADTDIDTDIDTDTDTDTDTDINPNAPQLLTWDLSLEAEILTGSLTLVDSDNDLVGGQLHLSNADGSTELDLPIPGAPELTWDQFGVSLVALPFSLDCAGVDESWTVTVEDFAGNTSQPLTADFFKAGAGTFPELEPTDLGTIDFPIFFCSTVDDDTDNDSFDFISNYAGDVTMTMTWTELYDDIDFRLYLCDPVADPYDPCGVAAATEICVDCAWTGNYPEVLTTTLDLGTLYRLRVLPFSVGAPQGYTMDIVP